jgi:hypothetical protein
MEADIDPEPQPGASDDGATLPATSVFGVDYLHLD